MASVPSLSEFNPKVIPYQYEVIKDVRSSYRYDLGVHDVLLSGSVGSAKSILLAHLITTHCLLYPEAGVLIGRRSMPSLRDTLLQMIVDHLSDEIKYKLNLSRGTIEFPNGSRIIPYSWSDRKYKKVRSYALSMGVIEELTENEEDDWYKEIRMRIGRLPHVPESLMISATNPGPPSHWAYEYFIEKSKDDPTRHVYYSKTADNPFLPKTYIQNLKAVLTHKEYLRMAEGQWLEITTDVIYYAFDTDLSVMGNEESYTVNPLYPICICYDFNIGEGKPMSVVLFQYIRGVFYFFDEVVIHGSRTEDTLDDMDGRGLLDFPTHYLVHGDASSRSRSTAHNKTDYEVIRKYLSTYERQIGPIDFEIDVPVSNPPVRQRHIMVNGQLKNAEGKTHVKIFKKCQTLIKGFRLTKLKKGGRYIEDDSDEFQHITTAAGYGIVAQLKKNMNSDNFRKRKIWG